MLVRMSCKFCNSRLNSSGDIRELISCLGVAPKNHFDSAAEAAATTDIDDSITQITYERFA